ncbi:CrcB family protein [Leifsonia sp. YIM 134122]|uniref:Fluoride-specific ion channel FluC n=1 Tax=Leifsonia stereocauli TaxID=3134136 RepID=A0ABU9W6V9_9MICO
MGRDLIAVFVGGLVGTGLRLSIDAALPHAGAQFPWSTLIINVVGALILGLLVGVLWKKPGLPHWVRAGLGAGVLGSFTTFSAVMVSVVGMSAADAVGPASVYLVASLVLGLAAAFTGLRVGSTLAHLMMPGEVQEGETL